MYEERGAGRKKEGEGATGDGEKREGDGGKDIELRRRPEGAKHDKSSQPSNRRLPAHNDEQASGSGERGPESPAKQLKYGELQGEREGEGVTGYGKKREGDGGKDIELQRQGEGAKHNVSSQPSSRRYSAHNDVQASGSGVRAQESLAKQLKNGELQEEREGVDDTSDDEKREGNGGKDMELRRQPEGAKHDESSQPKDRRFPAHNDVHAGGSGEHGTESLAKQLRYGELQKEKERDNDTENNRSAELQEEHEQEARHN